MEQWRKNLYILWFAVFLLMAAMTSIIPFLPLYIKQEMGIGSEHQVALWSGLIFGINFFMAFLVSPLWGKLADKYGRKLMVLRAGFGMAIIITSMGLATNVYHLFFLRLLNGLFSGFNPASIALVAANTPKEKAGFALGTLQSGSVAGSIIGPLIGGILAEYIGFRNIFLYTGIMILVAVMIVLIFVKEEFKPDKKTMNKGFVTDFKIIANTQPLLSLFFVGFMIQFAALNVMPVLPLYIESLAPPGDRVSFFAGLIAATTGFANMLASPRLGKLGDKYGSERILFFSLLGAAALFIPQSFSTNVWQLMIWRFFLGITLGGLLPSLNSLIRHYAPKGMVSRTFGYSSSATFLGNMTGPIVGGSLAGIIGMQGVFLFTSALLFINSIWLRKMVNHRIKSEDIKQKESLHV